MSTEPQHHTTPSPATSDVIGYLPLNLLSGKRDYGHRLARIDPAFRDELLQFNWRTTSTGIIYRVFRDVINSRSARRAINHVEHLALRLLDLPPGSEWYPPNGDRLDVRLLNLVPGRPPKTFVEDACGESFRNEPNYVAARHDLARQRSFYLKLFRHGPVPKLTDTQVRELLEAVRDDPLIRGTSLRNVARWMEKRFGFSFFPSYLHRVLRGDALRTPGFDYVSLLATRKTRAEIAREHWRLRRDASAIESNV
jgi:hypothetical protein